MRRLLLLFVAAAVAGAGCASTLGAVVPECDEPSGTIVLAVQSVPGSRYVSCIEALPVGWDYQDLTARSGMSQYALDSDRMGTAFLRVENLPACDVGEAHLDSEPLPGVGLWKDVDERTTIDVVLVAEGPTDSTFQRSVELLDELHGVEVRDRAVLVTRSNAHGTTAERIDAALADGAHVVIIGIRDVEEGTIGVRLRDSDSEVTVGSVSDLIDLLESTETKPSYVGSWYYVFDGGCVRYTFDAEGPGAASLDADVVGALGLYNADDLRALARGLGYEIP
jgi:hypothetical protein